MDQGDWLRLGPLTLTFTPTPHRFRVLSDFEGIRLQLKPQIDSVPERSWQARALFEAVGSEHIGDAALKGHWHAHSRTLQRVEQRVG